MVWILIPRCDDGPCRLIVDPEKEDGMNGDYSIIERPPLRVLLIEDNSDDADLVRLGLEGESSFYSDYQHIA